MTLYDGPIVDAHLHFWKPSLGLNPWLLPGAQVPFRYGDYEAIKRDYLPDDYLRDANGFNIVDAVYVETEWDPAFALEEIAFVDGIRTTSNLPGAAVAHTALNDPAAKETLERLAEHAVVRGIRDKPGGSASPETRGRHSSLMVDDEWVEGYRQLERYDFTFDLQVSWWHLDEAAELAKRYPGIVMVIDHAALPSDRTPEGLGQWASALRAVAHYPNVAIKVSGLGLPGHAWTVQENRTIVETVAEIFGSDRIMFASNFPVDSLCGSFADIYGGFLEISREWSRAEQSDAFANTASRVYRLNNASPR